MLTIFLCAMFFFLGAAYGCGRSHHKQYPEFVQRLRNATMRMDHD